MLRTISEFIDGQKWLCVYQKGNPVPVFKTRCPALLEYFINNWQG